MPKHEGMSLYSWSTKNVEPPRVKVSHRAGDKCPWVTNREKKEEKTTKYGPLRWKLAASTPEGCFEVV